MKFCHWLETGKVGCGCSVQYVTEMDYFVEHFLDCVPRNTRVPQDGYEYFKRKNIQKEECSVPPKV